MKRNENHFFKSNLENNFTPQINWKFYFHLFIRYFGHSILIDSGKFNPFSMELMKIMHSFGTNLIYLPSFIPLKLKNRRAGLKYSITKTYKYIISKMLH